MGSGNNQIRVTGDRLPHYEPKLVYSMQGTGAGGGGYSGRYGGTPPEQEVHPNNIAIVQNNRPQFIQTGGGLVPNQINSRAVNIIPVCKPMGSAGNTNQPFPSQIVHVTSPVSPSLQVPDKIPVPRPVEVMMYDRSRPNPLVEVVKDFKKWGITVTDPLEKRKVACPFFKISPTNGLLDSSSKAHTHSICILYQNGRCKVEQNCNQIHVDRMYYNMQRIGSPCCAVHHDLFTSSLLNAGVVKLPHIVLVTTYKGRRQSYIWPGELVSLSLGLSHCPVKVVEGQDCIVVDNSRVCQVWQGSRCTYGKECNYVHICRSAYANLPRDVQQRQQKYRPVITSPSTQPSVVSHQLHHSSANSSSGSSSCDGSKHGSPPSQVLPPQAIWPNTFRDSKEDLLLSQCNPHTTTAATTTTTTNASNIGDDSPSQTVDVEGILSNFANLFSGSQNTPTSDKEDS